jgi:WD40 repeat protein
MTDLSKTDRIIQSALQERLDALTEEYQAVSKQVSYSLSNAEQIRLKRQIAHIEAEMKSVEQKLQEVGLVRRQTEPANTIELRSPFLGHTYHINAIALNQENSLLVSGSGDLKAIVWQIATGEPKGILKHKRWIGSVSFAPDDKLVATSDGNGEVRLWEWETQNIVANANAHDGPCRTLAFSPDGQYLATGGGDARICFWEMPALERAFELTGQHTGEIRRLAFSPDGNWLVSVGDDGLVCLWSLINQTSNILIRESNIIWRSAAFAPDGKSFAITNSLGVILLWNVSDNIASWRVTAHQGAAIGVAFHPENHVLVTGGQDCLIRFWERKSGKLLDTIAEHQGAVTCLAFANDGRRLFSSSRDSTIRIWSTRY